MIKEKVILIISIIISLLITTSYVSKTKDVNDLVRVHVIANSDSEVDQKIKIKVKEEIEKYIVENYMNLNSINDILKRMYEDQEKIENIAEKNCNKRYKVKTEIMASDFPLKEYQNKIVEQGRYNTLNIILGEGRGHNWWQAIYPKLSYIDESYEIIEDKGTDKIEYQIRFKSIEMLKKVFFQS